MNRGPLLQQEIAEAGLRLRRAISRVVNEAPECFSTSRVSGRSNLEIRQPTRALSYVHWASDSRSVLTAKLIEQASAKRKEVGHYGWPILNSARGLCEVEARDGRTDRGRMGHPPQDIVSVEIYYPVNGKTRMPKEYEPEELVVVPANGV